MKAHKYCFLFLLAVLLHAASGAQERRLTLGVHQVTGIPAGNFTGTTDKASGRGFEATVLYGLSDRFSIGGAAGFQDFYRKYPRQVLHEPGSDVSAVISNSVQVMPLMARGRYHFSPAGPVQPYVSLAAGAGFISYRRFYGEVTVDQKNAIGFAAQPEIGLRLPVGINKTSGFHLAAGYNFMPYRYNELKGLNHAVIKAGFSFALR